MTTPNASGELTPRQRARDEALAAEMREVEAEIARVDKERDRLFARRLRVWRRAVKADWTHPRIAAASGASESNVSQQLRRDRLGHR